MQKPSLAKRIVAPLFGVPTMLLGIWYLSTLARLILANGMRTVEGYLIATSAVCVFGYCIFLGIISLRFAILGIGKSRLGVTWWRVILGAILIAIELKNQIAPAPNLLKADNEGEQVGMWIAAILICCFGLWLIISGIRTKYPRASGLPDLPIAFQK